MNTTRTRHWQVAVLAGVLLSGLHAGAASAAPHHDPDLTAEVSRAHSSIDQKCWLSRVGTQFVRCDDLTGNGVQAPLWVPTR
jgi:hypothetical protein